MKAREVLESIVIHEMGEARHEPTIQITHGGDFVAHGYMTDPDGRQWRVRVEALDA